ncbi:hypothetical protein B0O41_2983 [Propionibacteriaceae bacterium ES.041]|nr:hypothetical protein B0O41_2983 [Propionibacteriaceae bacterium ES.041]
MTARLVVAAISYPMPLFAPVTSAVLCSLTRPILLPPRRPRPKPIGWSAIPHRYRP